MWWTNPSTVKLGQAVPVYPAQDHGESFGAQTTTLVLVLLSIVLLLLGIVTHDCLDCRRTRGTIAAGAPAFLIEDA